MSNESRLLEIANTLRTEQNITDPEKLIEKIELETERMLVARQLKFTNIYDDNSIDFAARLITEQPQRVLRTILFYNLNFSRKGFELCVRALAINTTATAFVMDDTDANNEQNLTILFDAIQRRSVPIEEFTITRSHPNTVAFMKLYTALIRLRPECGVKLYFDIDAEFADDTLESLIVSPALRMLYITFYYLRRLSTYGQSKLSSIMFDAPVLEELQADIQNEETSNVVLKPFFDFQRLPPTLRTLRVYTANQDCTELVQNLAMPSCQLTKLAFGTHNLETSQQLCRSLISNRTITTLEITGRIDYASFFHLIAENNTITYISVEGEGQVGPYNEEAVAANISLFVKKNTSLQTLILHTSHSFPALQVERIKKILDSNRISSRSPSLPKRQRVNCAMCGISIHPKNIPAGTSFEDSVVCSRACYDSLP